MHQLFHIYEEQNPEIETTFEEMTEDDINVMLLTVEANVLFNEKRNAVQIVKDWTNTVVREVFHQQQYYEELHYFFKGKKTVVFRNAIT